MFTPIRDSALLVGCAVTVCLSLLLPAASRAQQISPQTPQTELVTLMQLLSQVNSSDARFTEEKHNALLARPLLLSGRLSYVRGGRVTRTVSAPNEERVTVEGDTLTVENSARGTQKLSLRANPAAWAFVEGFRATLAGDLPTLERYYRIKYGGSIAAWSLELVPKDEQMTRYLESITFHGNRGAITAILVAEAGGGRSSMKITPDVP